MNYFFKISLVSILFFSCSSKKQVLYISNFDNSTSLDIDSISYENTIQVGDILKIDVYTTIPEASIPYNINNSQNPNRFNNIDFLKLEGYLVDNLCHINFPVLGKINVKNLTTLELESVLKKILVNGNHLSDPTVIVRRINSKFTVLGEVRTPGTYSFFENKITLFQALGYAGDLTIDGKRNKIKLIRQINKKREIFDFSLTDVDILNQPYYEIINNDIIIVSPNFSKVKSAGFIGSPQSISSIASILLSISLIIINN